MKINGLKDFQKNLKQLEKTAKKVQETGEIPFDQLFSSTFMKKYTNYSSFDELLEKGGFVVNSQEDFEKIPDDVFDKHISENTKFANWEKMQVAATEEYIAKQLGF
jgi:butyrate kinase